MRDSRMGYFIPHLSKLVVRHLLPRADRPTRRDLPGGSLIELISSFESMKLTYDEYYG